MSLQGASNVLTLPERANSEATLRLAGFSASGAKTVFAKYEKMIEEGESIELDTVAKEHITGQAKIKDAFRDGDDYAGALKGMGMEVDAIMKAEHKMTRLTKSASSHFKDSVDATAKHVEELAKGIGNKRHEIDAAICGTKD